MDVLSVSLILGGLLAFYLYFKWIYAYWERRGVPTVPGALPLVGHLLPILFLRTNLSKISHKWYHMFKDSSVVGFYEGTQPALLLRDPELVKTVMMTNFSNFDMNTIKIDPKIDPLLAKNPFFMHSEGWLKNRKRLTYAFSSMRLKTLSEVVRGVCKKFDDYLEKKIPPGERVAFELKDLYSRFTGEVVANAGFGIEGHCFEEKSNPQSFREIGREIFEPSTLHGMIQAIVFFLPLINKIFQIRFIPVHVDKFFRTIVKQVLESRKNETVKRNDFIQLMSDLEKSEGETIDEETLVAHALSFFVDGYETSSATVSFVTFELSLHPKIQEKVREEIQRVLANHNGVITYEALKEMTYMDQVIYESQRLNTVLNQLGKLCTNAYELKGSDGRSVRVDSGTKIIIPIHDLQRDPKYWSDPETFDPDRWSDERKTSIHKFAFIPFGEGPRMCPGMRMAQLQMKAAMATLLRKYKVERNPRTTIPLKITLSSILSLAEEGLWTYIRRL